MTTTLVKALKCCVFENLDDTKHLWQLVEAKEVHRPPKAHGITTLYI